MEDVLATYEQPLNPAEPVVCLDEKPVTLLRHTATTTGSTGQDRQAGQRVRTLRNRERVLRRRAQSRPALHVADSKPVR